MWLIVDSLIRPSGGTAKHDSVRQGLRILHGVAVEACRKRRMTQTIRFGDFVQWGVNFPGRLVISR